MFNYIKTSLQGCAQNESELAVQYAAALAELGIYAEVIDHPAHRAIVGVLDYLYLTFADCMSTLIMKADGQDLALIIRAIARLILRR